MIQLVPTYRKPSPYMMTLMSLAYQLCQRTSIFMCSGGLRGEFKDLVTNFSTKAEPFTYTDLHGHLLTHEYLHKSSLSPIVGSHTITSLLPTPSSTSSTFFVQRQPPQSHGQFVGSYDNNSNRGSRSKFHDGWRKHIYNNHSRDDDDILCGNNNFSSSQNGLSMVVNFPSQISGPINDP